jgi:hypothetical protein
MASSGTFNKHKPKRIDKELMLLRNLPKEYKIGKKDSPLGTVLYVDIAFQIRITLIIYSLRLTSH